MHRLSSLICILLLSGNMVEPFPQSVDDYDYGDENYGDDGPTVEDVYEEPVALPVFQSQDKTLTVREGDDVELDCTTVLPTDHMLLMTKDDDKRGQVVIFVGLVKVLTRTRFQQKKNGTFSIQNIRRAQAGRFQCQFQASPPVTLTYTIDVQYPPSMSLATPPEQRVAKGGSVTMTCKAKGNPEPQISWSKSKGMMPSGKQTEEGLSITLQNVDRHVQGTYICSAENGVGEPTFKESRLFVEYPPEIITEKAIIRTGEGDKVELVCNVHARPMALVTWTKDDSPLEMGVDVTESEGAHRHTITIEHVTEENFGTYECLAKNVLGEDIDIINLTDLPKMPHFTSEPTSAKEDEYPLTWETESYYPITEYILQYRGAKVNETSDEPGQWIDEPVEVSDEEVLSNGLNHKMNYTIRNLTPATDYQVKLTVKNQYKWGAEANFDFSTKKASPPTTQTPFSANEENPEVVDEESMGHRVTGASYRVNSSLFVTVITALLCVSVSVSS